MLPIEPPKFEIERHGENIWVYFTPSPVESQRIGFVKTCSNELEAILLYEYMKPFYELMTTELP